MNTRTLQELVSQVTASLVGTMVDVELGLELDERFPADGDLCNAMRAACEEGIAEGWMCQHEAGGIKYGRVIKAGPETHGFSVDVVVMKDVVGPHHRHPKGEIDLIMPIDPGARFDGHGAGWLVYGPDSAHRPTVTDGAAIVLYLLPDGAIEFTK